MNPNRMSCGEVREKLPLYVGGDLDPDVLEAVRGHVERCAECARLSSRAMGARRVLVASFRAQESDVERPGLWPGIRAKLVAEGRFHTEGETVVRTAAPRRSRARWAWALAPLAAAAMLLAFLQLENARDGGSKILPQAPVRSPELVADTPAATLPAGTLRPIPANEVRVREVYVPSGVEYVDGQLPASNSGDASLAGYGGRSKRLK